MSGRSLKFGGFGRSGGLGSQQGDKQGSNVSTTTITAMECRQCIPLRVVQLKGKYCQKPIAVTGSRYVWARPAGIPTEAFINPVLKRGPLSRL